MVLVTCTYVWSNCIELHTHEEGTATHFSILSWRIPWTEEPGRLQSMGSQRVGHDWSNLAHTYTLMHAHTHEHTHPHTNMSSSITNEIWISSLDCTNVHFLMVTLSCVYGRCCHLGKLDEGCMGPPWTFLHSFLWIYKYFKTKS